MNIYVKLSPNSPCHQVKSKTQEIPAAIMFPQQVTASLYLGDMKTVHEAVWEQKRFTHVVVRPGAFRRTAAGRPRKHMKCSESKTVLLYR